MKLSALFRRSMLAACIGLFSIPSLAAAPDLPALFAKDPTIFDFKISPDGQHLAAKVMHEERIALVFFDRATMKMLNSVKMGGDGQVGEYHWVNNDRVIFKLTQVNPWQQEPEYFGELYGVNIDGGKRGLLFGYRAGEQQVGSNFKAREARRAWAEFVDVVPDENNRILIKSTPMTFDGEAFPEVLAMDIFSGKTASRGRLPVSQGQVEPGPNGRPRVVAGLNSKNQTEVFIRAADSTSNDWEQFPAQQYGDTFTPIAVASDNKSVYVFDNRKSSRTGVHRMDLSNGKFTEVYTDPNVDVSTVIPTTDQRAVYGIRVDDGRPAYILLTGEYEEAKVFKDLLATFPGEKVSITSRTADGKQWVVLVSSDVNPGTYYLYNHEKVSLAKLADYKAHLKDVPLAAMEPVSFAAADGYKVHGYLTKALKPSANKPMVVLVHGGPHFVRDQWEFNSEVQMLALSGYNVLQVNYRGSGGYGQAHQIAGYRQWGGLIQQDIIAGTQWAIAQGHANAGNVCIMGASFGAYSTVQAATLAPDLYKCGVAVAGVYDLPLMKNSGDIPDAYFGKAYLQQVLGEDPAQLQQFSPVHQVTKLKAELLIMHGERDERAPFEHAKRLKAALDKAGKPYQWLVFDDETHGFYGEHNQTIYLKNVQDFLAKQLKI